MNRIESLLATVLASCAIPVIAACAGTPGAPTPAVAVELAPTDALRVAVFTGNPVIGTKDKATGEVKGTTVTLGRALAARAGVPATIIEYTSVAKIVEDAKTGTWDIAVVAFDPARRGVLNFATEMCIVLPKGRPAALEYVGAFVSEARKSGLIARVIEGAGLRGAAVAQGVPAVAL